MDVASQESFTPRPFRHLARGISPSATDSVSHPSRTHARRPFPPGTWELSLRPLGGPSRTQTPIT